MYIRHVDGDEQKIEMWLCPDPPKEVEIQMGHLLAGLFVTLKNVARLPKQDAMNEMSRLALYLIACAERRGVSPPTSSSTN
ncbi:MAG: hypothetical protein HZA36_03140 [Parcubacteria group bacterium]|nr:hypothetical protein [Parcubacteria group bacterium]